MNIINVTYCRYICNDNNKSYGKTFKRDNSKQDCSPP